MTQIKMCTASGEEHGLISTLPNSVPFTDFKNMKADHAEKCRKEMKEDGRTVKARYINHEGRNERLEKSYCRWPGEPIQKWKLIPDHEYALPMGFVKEVNETRRAIRSGLQTIDGEPINKDGSPLEKDQFVRVHELVPTKF